MVSQESCAQLFVLVSVMNAALEDVDVLELKGGSQKNALWVTMALLGNVALGLDGVLEEFAALEFERALGEHFVLSSLRGLEKNLALGLEGSSKERADLNSKRV